MHIQHIFENYIIDLIIKNASMFKLSLKILWFFFILDYF